jgi:penicillin-binding protein 2
MIQSSRFRLLLLGLAIIGGFGLLLVRLWYLQIEKQDVYMKKLPGTREVLHRIPGARGRILDRNGVELARNKTTLQIGLDLGTIVQYYQDTHKGNLPKFEWNPTKEPETDIVKIVQEVVIAPLFKMGLASDVHEEKDKALEFEDHLRKHYRTNRGEIPFNYIRNVNWDVFAKFAEHNHNLPGVTISQRLLREYPFGALTGHMLGYVRLFDKEIPDDDKGKYKFYEGDDKGVAALEMSLDKYLRGKPGFRTLLINEHGRLERELTESYIAPQAGDDVYLTIDIRMQYIAEMALRDGGVGRGAIVLQDPNTGEILAMVAVPNYDPNNFIPSITKEKYKVYHDDDTVPLLNRAIVSFNPGSTFKVATGLAGFLAHPGQVNQYYSCDGTVSYGGREFPCWTRQKKTAPHGSVDLSAALKYSCNCYFYQYGNDAGLDNIDKMGAMVGLGRPTGIEIPGESGGLIPTRQWVKDNPLSGAVVSVTANVSIGQVAEASPLQMASLTSTVANGGRAYYPTLIHHRVDRTSKAATKFTPRIRTDLAKEKITPKQIESIRKGMWKVVNEQGGTGSKFKSLLPEIAEKGGGSGKTGTAQWKRKGVKDNHTWFICFAPYDQPKLSAAILVQGGNSGGSCAGPVARRVIEQCISLEANTYRVDPASIGKLAEAKGHFNYIESVKYENEINVPELPESDAESGIEDENARESAVVLKVKPVEAPIIQNEGAVVAPKARPVVQPKYKANTPNP